jgi:hypothetical protein
MRTWVASIVDCLVLEPEDFTVLILAAQAWDDVEKARIVLARRGTTYLDRFLQPRNRPEVAQLRDARIAFARLMSQLPWATKKRRVQSRRARRSLQL